MSYSFQWKEWKKEETEKYQDTYNEAQVIWIKCVEEILHTI